MRLLKRQKYHALKLQLPKFHMEKESLNQIKGGEKAFEHIQQKLTHYTCHFKSSQIDTVTKENILKQRRPAALSENTQKK